MPSNDQRNKRKRRGRTPSPNPMEEILSRLRALEDQSRASVETQAVVAASATPLELVSAPAGTPPLTPRASNMELTQSEDVVTNAAERLLTAISCAQRSMMRTPNSHWTRRLLLSRPQVPAEGFEHAAPSGEAVLGENYGKNSNTATGYIRKAAGHTVALCPLILLFARWSSHSAEALSDLLIINYCNLVRPEAIETSLELIICLFFYNNMVSPNSVGANCEIDNTFCLQNLKYFLTQKVIRPLPKNIEINFDHLNIELPNIEHLIKSQAPEDLEKCAAAAYCCGWLISLIYKSVIKKCEFCKNDLEGDSEEAFSKFITLKKHTDKCILHYPNKQLLECFIHIEEISINILQNTCQSPTIANYIELVTSTLISLNFLKCENHHL